MNTLSIDIAGKEWRNILQDALMGVPSIITQAGKPVAEIKPLKSERSKPVFGCARGQIEISDDFDRPFAAFEHLAVSSSRSIRQTACSAMQE